MKYLKYLFVVGAMIWMMILYWIYSAVPVPKPMPVVAGQPVATIPATPRYGPGILPDPQLTPGATNPDVTQDNIGGNICNPKWSTSSIRPPSSYTTKLKETQLANGYAVAGDTNTADYEEDHLISLEIGGNPTDPANLWPESYKTTPNARDKDAVENWLHKEVCSDSMTLAEAQREISTDWYVVYQQLKQ